MKGMTVMRHSVVRRPGLARHLTATLLSVAVTGRSGDVLIFYSREAGAALAPRLIVTYN